MSEALRDMLAAMNGLADSIRQVNIGRSIKDAQAEVDKLKANEGLDDFEKMRAQRAIAQATGAKVASLGGNAFSQQQALAILSPQDVDTKMAQLEATGERTVAGAVNKLQEQERQLAREDEDRKFQQQLKLEYAKANIRAQSEANKPKKYKGLLASEGTTINKARLIGTSVGKMENIINNMSDAEFITPAAFSRDQRMLQALKANAQDIITRLRTGAALNESEVKFYDDLMTGKTSSGAKISRQRMLDQLGVLKDMFGEEHRQYLKTAIAEERVSPDTAFRLIKSGEQAFGAEDSDLRGVMSDAYGFQVPNTQTNDPINKGIPRGENKAPPAQQQQAPVQQQAAPPAIPGLTFRKKD